MDKKKLQKAINNLGDLSQNLQNNLDSQVNASEDDIQRALAEGKKAVKEEFVEVERSSEDCDSVDAAIDFIELRQIVNEVFKDLNEILSSLK